MRLLAAAVSLSLLPLSATAFGIGCVSIKAVHRHAGATPRTKHFRYLHLNTTGQNQYVLAGRTAIPIYMDEKRSVKQELDSLRALKGNIFSPNSEGNIVFVGYLDPKPVPLPTAPNAGDPPGSVHYHFVLKGWYLAAPFMRDAEEDSRSAHARRSIRGTWLGRRDFDTQTWSGQKFDPMSPSFDPRKHVKRLRLRTIGPDDYQCADKGVPERTIRSAGWVP
jgi:hypothetical protein